MLFPGFSLGVTGPEWWLTQSKVFFFYLKMVAWPWPLLLHYHMPYLKTLAESWMYVVPLLLIGLATLGCVVAKLADRVFGWMGIRHSVADICDSDRYGNCR